MVKSKIENIISWIAASAAAIIMLQTLFFKFTAAPESVYIFSTLGIEPVGRIGSGIAEAIASLLIITPSFRWLGAILGLGIMSGAIVAHLTKLGIEVQADGGYLFFLAIAVFCCCALCLFLDKEKCKALFNKLLNR